MREHEYRMVKRRVDAPPPVPWLLGIPGTRMAAEHVATHDGGADVRHRLFDDGRALVDDAAVHSLHLPPDSKRKYPLVQPHAADAERVLHALTGPGDETVERHRNFQA